jgi:hypothetical protein
VQRGTDYEPDTCNDIGLRIDILGPNGSSFFSLHRHLMPLFTPSLRNPSTGIESFGKPVSPSKLEIFDRVFPENHARLTEIQSAFIEHPQKQPNQLDFVIWRRSSLCPHPSLRGSLLLQASPGQEPNLSLSRS